MKEEPKSSLPAGSARLHLAGLRVTSPRVKIWHVLETASVRHLSAEEIYQTLHANGDDVNLATVYRVLSQFAEAGLVIRQNFEGGRCVFELDQGVHHDHLVCVQCSYVAEFVDDDIEQRQRIVAEKAGFNMSDHTLTIYGLCKRCQHGVDTNA